MADWTYLILDAGAVGVAVGLALWRRLSWLQHLQQAALAVSLVGFVFLVWDMAVTHLGHWSFNADYILDWYVGNLPLEEVSFFVAIPLVCLTVWQILERRPARNSPSWPGLLMIPVVGALMLVTTFSNRGYSLAAGGAAIVVNGWLYVRRATLPCQTWLTYQLVMLVIFYIANSVLTGLPVVEYNPQTFSGIRIGSIPLEDFFYNFALTNAVILAYLQLEYRAKAAARATA